ALQFASGNEDQLSFTAYNLGLSRWKKVSKSESNCPSLGTPEKRATAGKAIRDDEGIYEGFADGKPAICLPS
ncbi:MAG: hypothetical protein WAM44_16125, partial [Chthoniobacterales bacterium]